jgi:predicted DNA-binding protein (MmcQ/YjbR family)
MKLYNFHTILERDNCSLIFVSMNIEVFREYCLSKPMTTEELPFDDRALVFKVAGKIFAITDIELFERVNLKCDPERAIEHREQYDQVNPGFHMNKKHWNTITIEGVPSKLFLEWVDHSYEMVIKGLPKKMRDEISSMA